MKLKRFSHAFRFSYMILLVVHFFLSSASAQHIKHFDLGGPKGANPLGGLTLDPLGNFYGTTFSGGSAQMGLVYEMSPAPNGQAMQIVLYNFSGSNGDGANPRGDLTLDAAGNLYGITQNGGEFNQGTVFELSPPVVQGGAWTEVILYSFQGLPSDGAQPTAGMVLDTVGNLYGTTSMGGIDSPACDHGCGTVFELSPPAIPAEAWTETVLYFFQGEPDGSTPFGGLIFDSAGNLYSTTSGGGSSGGGTIFEVSPPSVPGGDWSETVLHAFIGNDGAIPLAGLAFGPNGALFGTTSCCGPKGATVFRLQPPSQPGGTWSLVVLHSTPGENTAGVTIAKRSYTLRHKRRSGSEFRIPDNRYRRRDHG